MSKKVNLKALKAAAAYVCNLNGGSIPEIALIKILYEAERSAIMYSLYSITGDSFMSYQKGPILNSLLFLIRDKGKISKEHGADWKTFFELKQESQRSFVSLKKAPDMDEISQMDKEYLDKAYRLYYRFLSDPTDKKLVHFSHKRYKEWDREKRTISKQDILSQYYDAPVELAEMGAQI